jgi:hypothetical protein
MSSNKFSRFQHIERARGEKPTPDGQVKLQNGGRFESVAGPGETVPASVSVPEAHVERFKLHGQTPLALDHEPEQGQFFPRCIRCEATNGRFAQACTVCGADLQSPEQLADNARRGQEEAQAEAQLREQVAGLQQAHRDAEAERFADKQRYQEELAQAFEKERTFAGKLAPYFEPCLGLGLLRLIRHPLGRWMAVAGAIGLPLLLVRFGNEALRVVGLYLGVLVLVSFIPTWLLRRQTRHWW